MPEVNDTAIEQELQKLGKTLAKIGWGIVSFLGGIVENVSPFFMELITGVLSKLGENLAIKILKKNGVEIE